MKRTVETVAVEEWMVWTEFDEVGRPISGRRFTDKLLACEYADRTGGRLEFIGEVYPWY